MKKIFLIPLGLLALSSCDNNSDNPPPSSEPLQICATIGERQN